MSIMEKGQLKKRSGLNSIGSYSIMGCLIGSSKAGCFLEGEAKRADDGNDFSNTL